MWKLWGWEGHVRNMLFHCWKVAFVGARDPVRAWVVRLCQPQSESYSWWGKPGDFEVFLVLRPVKPRSNPFGRSSPVQCLIGSNPVRQRLCSASSLDYIVPRTRTKFADRAFSVAGPTVWNSLPESVRSAETLASFKRKQKTYLFNVLF